MISLEYKIQTRLKKFQGQALQLILHGALKTRLKLLSYENALAYFGTSARCKKVVCVRFNKHYVRVTYNPCKVSYTIHRSIPPMQGFQNTLSYKSCDDRHE